MYGSQIYTTGADRKVSLSVPVTPVTGTLDVFVYENDVEVFEVTTVTAETGGLSFILPFSLIQNEKELEVRWTFDYVENSVTYTYSSSSFVDVVTPILPLSTVKAILGVGFDDEDAATVEQAVRYVIQAHTGQSFGKFVGPKTVVGRGEPILRLPSRLLKLTSVNDVTSWDNSLVLAGGGWQLQTKTINSVPPIKADYYGLNEYTYHSGVPITVPWNNGGVFLTNTNYVLDGEWGWNFVPSAVQEAAALLIHDYACADITYRDRFLTSMTAADWRIQFHAGAFSNTGNARANLLLEDFIVKFGWVVF